MFSNRTEQVRPVSRVKHGFSLIELVVVIVIIGILASLVAFRTRSYLVVSKQNAAKLDISRFVQAIDTYYAAHDAYPSNEAGLELLTAKGDMFVDGIVKSIPLDPWKNPYQYNSPGADSAYEVICLGADKREGGEGADRDISSEDLDRGAE